ncbi:polysaccharide biosynthesis protein [Vibrio sp. S4M6]|uniref:polysaccharide biosynthesis protein n=1 Tax=Vibrio sinus TaxID=2946865 RepID=UPI002029EDF9|nr:nucleoside-diphosphate sugar epimerase/dehydratase [Vibrio sinus]MCL9780373.1 polysaccharide biosynthesis protein [Vibrio sinus]
MVKLNFIWNLSRLKKRILGLVIDTIFIVVSFYGAYWVRIGTITNFSNPYNHYIVVITLFITLVVFSKLGLYRAILRYLTFHALAVISLGTVVSAFSISVLAFYFDSSLPRSVPIIYGSFLCILCGGSRLTVRALVSEANSKSRRRVLIYGVGAAGRQLALALKNSDSHKVIGFIDDDKTLENNVVMGLLVSPVELVSKLTEKYKVEQILLAVPSANRSRRRQILDSLVHLPVEVLTIPDMKDIVSGKAKIDEFQDVEIADLLGRDCVEPEQCLMQKNIKGKVVMVTGAGGSIGAELCRQIIKSQPRTLILFELSEFALYKVDRELSSKLASDPSLAVELVPLLGSVQGFQRLSTTMKSFKVQTVYHAAAYKHVPLVEFNVVEGVRNNVFGTYSAAKAALEAQVESFVLISTDKAVRPTNVMGTTKRVAELGLQALASGKHSVQNSTRFSMVRFGNVLGSSGSVIPLFKQQIENGGPITVTHPDIIRYFMTITEAAQLVIQAGAMAKGGDVFVLDMGEPVKITDLAVNLVQLSGLEVKNEENPYGDIEIKYSGLRPGEKLYEELLIGKNVSITDHPRIMTAKERFLPFEEFEELLEKLDKACCCYDQDLIRDLLLSAPTDFAPSDKIGDLVWNQLQGSSPIKNKVIH